jgi:hypothetical protein
MNMHRCLQIDEILRRVLDIDQFWLHELLIFALVSKVFLEPALDLLWAEQDSLLRLIKTFPQDLWMETGDPLVLVSLYFPIIAILFHRFLQTRHSGDLSPSQI